MSVEFPSFGRVPGTEAPRVPAEPSEADRRQVAQLSQEFEAMLLLQLVRQMRQALLEEQDPGEGLGSATMTDTFDTEFARYLSQAGGVGLARVIAGSMGGPASKAGADVISAAAGVDTSTSRSAAPRPASPVGAPEDGPSAPRDAADPGTGAPGLPLEAPVSSPFGWRTDPFLGTPRFHGGVDLKAAFGREVPTVAPGRVVFAGEQGGYGQTVVVEHAQGVRTRYAHLSAVAVHPGQELAEGEPVGRVGQSGRATGPHLHFEVWKDGRRRDPDELVRLLPEGLKVPGAGVDSPLDGAPAWSPSIGATDHED